MLFHRRNAKSISFAGVSFELAKVSDMNSRSIDMEIRELDAGLRPQSGPSDLLVQIRQGGAQDFIIIDLGSETAPRWLSSRLYLFALLLARVGRLKSFVFVETASGLRNRFIGTASPDSVRWALAQHYPWYEYAFAQAYSQYGLPQFDGNTGSLSEYEASFLAQQFLAAIRVPGPIQLPFPDLNHAPDTIDLGNGTLEYAVWLGGGRIERILGNNLSESFVAMPSDKSVKEMAAAVLRQHGRFVALVDPDRTFRSLVDRSAALENLAVDYLKQASTSGP
jgi:hypothetical protein